MTVMSTIDSLGGNEQLLSAPVNGKLGPPSAVVTKKAFMFHPSTRLMHSMARLGVSLAAISLYPPASAASLDAYAGVIGRFR